MSSPLKGSGHAGYRSPRKNRQVDVLDIHIAKLKSPMKRSMSELNKVAYENALKNKSAIIDATDRIAASENRIIEEIIAISNEDGLDPLFPEEDESERKSRKGRKPKLTSHKTHTTSKNSLEGKIPLLQSETGDAIQKENEKVELTRSPSLTPSVTPTVTPTKSPLKEGVLSQNQVSPLRRSTRKKVSVRDRLESVSTESSPRKRRNLHSTFNSMTDLIPKNHKSIKLMEPPKIDTEEDDLLFTDPMAKQKSLYHDGFEAYFEQNQTRSRVSKSSMTNAPDISYEEFNTYNKFLDMICTEPIKSLNDLYDFQFSQWLFELQEGFNLMFYGIGSKRTLLYRFLHDFILPSEHHAKCIVVNGYNTEFNLRMLMREIWRLCFKKTLPTAREVREACNFTQLEFMKSRNRNKKLYILLHNIDGDSLRNDDLQYMLSQLAIIKQVSLVCSLDNLNMPVFWDASVLSNFNFIWHNTSTFQSYITEVSFKDPLSIGKTDELVGSRGAKYVLSSLTGNAKNLYKNLILQQLEKIDTYIGDDTKLMENRGNTKGSIKTCISLREFYEICVAEFIISNDISFRAILGEFVEHKMCQLTRDTSGTEVLFISFSVDEMEKLLDEELMD